MNKILQTDRQTDRPTDRQADSSIPPSNFVCGGIKTISDFIKGTAFKKVVSATKYLALACDSPQLALTLGHYVKQIAFLKVRCGIITGSSECQQEGKDFQYLYEAHWNK